MQATDKIRDKTKPQVIQTTPVSASSRQVAHFYQRSITNTHANTSFLHLCNSIMGTITQTPKHLNEEWARLMRKGRYFSYKERGHTTYDCFKKGKIVAISEGVSEDNNSQEKV